MGALPRWLVPVLLLGLASPVRAGGLSFLQVERDGVGGVDGIRGASGVALSPDGAYVYATGRSDNAVAVFNRDIGTGALAFVEVQRDGVGGVDGLAEASGVAVSPDGAHVYVTGDLDAAVAVFSRSGGTGALTFVEVQKDGVGGVDGLSRASAVALSPDGKHVYVTGHDDDAVAVFSRNAVTGALTFVEVQRNGVGGVGGLRRPTAIALSPDGAHVYITGEALDTVAVFSRNAVTGALTFVEFAQDRQGSVGNLRGPQGVAVSPDGATVYVACRGDHGVAVFSRNGGTGALTYSQFTFAGLANSSVVVSPDDAYVYVTGSRGPITVLHRNPATGALRFLQSVAVLDGASAVAVSADGASLYVAGQQENALAAFAVDSCGNGDVGVDEECDDGNVIAGDGCSASCRLETCGPIPAAGCRHAESGRSRLKMTDKSNDVQDRLEFKFLHGNATTLADFGDPTTTASSVLCLYDGSGAPQPLLSPAAPAGGVCKGQPCWQLSGEGFLYKDLLLTPDGVSKVILRSGLDGRSRVEIKGRGNNLVLLPGLPFVAPVIVQVVNTETGVCWEAVFSSVPILSNGTSTTLDAISD